MATEMELHRVIGELRNALAARDEDKDVARIIALCSRALKLVSQEQQPAQWAYLHVVLGGNYLDSPDGNPADNVEQAIFHCQQALHVYTPVAYPELWGQTCGNLGICYYRRIRGDRRDNLESAIEILNSAFQVFSKETHPENWATIHNTLGGVYSERIAGVKADNLELAIQHYNSALEVRTRESFPEAWAATENNLGTVYKDRTCGDRADNIEQAIRHFLCALAVRKRSIHPKAWAQTQTNLANAYVERVRGHKASNIERALNHALKGLEVYTRKANLEKWVGAQMTLAGVYHVRIRGDRADNMEQALSHLQEVLEVSTQDAFPALWSGAMVSLGLTLRDRIRGNRADNIERAIKCFQDVLVTVSPEGDPNGHAIIQDDLALCFLDRILGERSENVELAIQCCDRGLRLGLQASHPHSWARLNARLGHGYRERLRGERGENIERSIAHSEEALKVFAVVSDPVELANVHNSLAIAFGNRSAGNTAYNIEVALQHSEEALRIWSPASDPILWANAHLNMAALYGKRQFGEKDQNISESIRHTDLALEVFTKEAYPVRWATGQNNLGLAYHLLTSGDRSDNIETARSHLELALDIYSPETYPTSWAETQFNLANCYAERMVGEKADNLQQAILHCRLALAVFTPWSNPTLCRGMGRVLGMYCQEAGSWREAASAFSMAIEADEAILSFTVSPGGQRNELYEGRGLYASAAYAFAQIGELERAVELAEAGRSRLLRETLEQTRADLARLPELGFRRLHDEYVNAAQVLSTMIQKAQSATPWPNWQADVEAANQAYRVLAQQIRAEVGREHPEFRYFMRSLPFSEIQLQASDVPIMYILSAANGGLGLLLTKREVRAIAFDGITEDVLYREVIQHYWPAYVGTSVERWMAELDRMTGWLWGAMVGRLTSALLAQNETAVILIPSGLLGLLPIHAAWEAKERGRTYALDKVTFSYVPSARVLMATRQQALSRSATSLMAVNNPDGSLTYADQEVRTALNYFSPDKSLHLLHERATMQAVRAAMNDYDILHFSTHGYADFQWPLSSGLLLANGEKLTLFDLQRSHLERPRLAILSACETGVIADWNLADEVISLPSGFLQAGVPGIISSLWSVNDLSTALLMVWFYYFWQDKGMQLPESLRQAQMQLRTSRKLQIEAFLKGDLDYQVSRHLPSDVSRELLKYVRSHKASSDETIFGHPFWWAAFIYTGS